MSVLLQTTLGELVIDLDTEGSPTLSRNFLKLVEARYYTGTLIYNVQPHRYCQLGDPRGDGTGGCSIYGLLDADEGDTSASSSSKRFLGRGEGMAPLTQCGFGTVAAVELLGVPNTFGSQFLIVLGGNDDDGDEVLPRERRDHLRSLGTVVEDDDGVLERLNKTYCDPDGRPYTDVRIRRALVIHDPYSDPPGFESLKRKFVDESPERVKPTEETLEERLEAASGSEFGILDEDDPDRREATEARGAAVVLEMLGDLPSADAAPPEHVAFVAKLNPVTEDEDLELIFSRFDESCRAEIVRDRTTGNSLHYAFVEFRDAQTCAEAVTKMNGALVDDRRIVVDFSQSVSQEWNKYTQQMRRKKAQGPNGNHSVMSRGPHGGRGAGGRGNGPGRGRGRGRYTEERRPPASSFPDSGCRYRGDGRGRGFDRGFDRGFGRGRGHYRDYGRRNDDHRVDYHDRRRDDGYDRPRSNDFDHYRRRGNDYDDDRKRADDRNNDRRRGNDYEGDRRRGNNGNSSPSDQYGRRLKPSLEDNSGSDSRDVDMDSKDDSDVGRHRRHHRDKKHRRHKRSRHDRDNENEHDNDNNNDHDRERGDNSDNSRRERKHRKSHRHRRDREHERDRHRSSDSKRRDRKGHGHSKSDDRERKRKHKHNHDK